MWPFTVGKDIALGNSLFGALRLTKNANFDKYKCYEYDIEFDARKSCSLSDSSGTDENVTKFFADMSTSASMYIDNKKRDILILGKGPTNGSSDTTFTAEKEYLINFTEQQQKFCLSLHKGVNSYILLNALKLC